MDHVYNPASWEANRTDAGVAILGTTWSSAFLGAAAGFGDDDVADLFIALAGLCGLATLIALTIIGCRLTFSASPEARASARAWAASQEPRPKAKRSDIQIMVLVALGVVFVTAVVIVLLTVMA